MIVLKLCNNEVNNEELIDYFFTHFDKIDDTVLFLISLHFKQSNNVEYCTLMAKYENLEYMSNKLNIETFCSSKVSIDFTLNNYVTYASLCTMLINDENLNREHNFVLSDMVRKKYALWNTYSIEFYKARNGEVNLFGVIKLMMRAYMHNQCRNFEIADIKELLLENSVKMCEHINDEVLTTILVSIKSMDGLDLSKVFTDNQEKSPSTSRQSSMK